MKYLFLNHKMNVTKQEFLTYDQQFTNLYVDTVKACVFPTFTNIPNAKNIKLIGSQNVSSYRVGSYTGEVSAKQLKEENVSYCLVGHSERRNILHEDNQEIKEKIERLQEEGIIPVLCIGEKQQKDFEQTIKEQLSVLNDASKELIIAYEPVYSIGTGVVLENAEIEQSITWIKDYMEREFHKIYPVLYGGSVDDKNIGKLNEIGNLDGFLVGKASLDIEKAKKMMEELK